MVTLGAGVVPAGDAAELTVADDGVGIPEALIEALFNPFGDSRTGTGGERGTGLGLAIVKRIVEGHGGTINVDSEVERGTTVTVRLPRVLPYSRLASSNRSRASILRRAPFTLLEAAFLKNWQHRICSEWRRCWCSALTA